MRLKIVYVTYILYYLPYYDFILLSVFCFIYFNYHFGRANPVFALLTPLSLSPPSASRHPLPHPSPISLELLFHSLLLLSSVLSPSPPSTPPHPQYASYATSLIPRMLFILIKHNHPTFSFPPTLLFFPSVSPDVAVIFPPFSPVYSLHDREFSLFHQ